MRVLGVIPARMESTRFPGKVLAPILGKPMIQWVWEALFSCDAISDVRIATDSDEVAEKAKDFCAVVVKTPKGIPTGTDRAAWVLGQEKREYDVVLNVQSDQPLITDWHLKSLLQFHSDMNEELEYEVSTLAYQSKDEALLFDRNIVKAVVGQHKRALYFSREPLRSDGEYFFVHMGIYALCPLYLEYFSQFPQTELEKTEHLEQLRALEHDFAIGCLGICPETDDLETRIPKSVDTPADIPIVESILRDRLGQRPHSV